MMTTNIAHKIKDVLGREAKKLLCLLVVRAKGGVALIDTNAPSGEPVQALDTNLCADR
jgi:hypothetical protein